MCIDANKSNLQKKFCRNEIWRTYQARDDVFNISIRTASALPAQVIQPGDAVHEEINNGDDDCDSNGVAPDYKSGDDAGAPIFLEIGAATRSGFVTWA